jgi:hypothetical protein
MERWIEAKVAIEGSHNPDPKRGVFFDAFVYRGRGGALTLVATRG